eukprot:14779813-Alexandrium_andersonii.AAC.1
MQRGEVVRIPMIIPQERIRQEMAEHVVEVPVPMTEEGIVHREPALTPPHPRGADSHRQGPLAAGGICPCAHSYRPG